MISDFYETIKTAALVRRNQRERYVAPLSKLRCITTNFSDSHVWEAKK